MVKDWKDETRKLQQKKLQERRIKGYVGELSLLTGNLLIPYKTLLSIYIALNC